MSKFIVLEGADGVGTTTQAFALEQELSRRYPVLRIAEPTGGPIGQLLRTYLKSDRSMSKVMELLFRADRIEDSEYIIRPWMAEMDGIVICDRYYLSTLVYQTLDERSEIVRLERMEEIRCRILKQDGVVKPDLILLLDAPLEVLKERRLSRGGAEECYDDDDTQRRVIKGYRSAYLEEVGAILEEVGAIGPISFINAVQSVEKVTADCMAAIEEWLGFSTKVR